MDKPRKAGCSSSPQTLLLYCQDFQGTKAVLPQEQLNAVNTSQHLPPSTPGPMICASPTPWQPLLLQLPQGRAWCLPGAASWGEQQQRSYIKCLVQTAGEGVSLRVYVCPWLAVGSEDHEAPDLPAHPCFHALGGKCPSPSREKDTPTRKVSKEA